MTLHLLSLGLIFVKSTDAKNDNVLTYFGVNLCNVYICAKYGTSFTYFEANLCNV